MCASVPVLPAKSYGRVKSPRESLETIELGEDLFCRPPEVTMRLAHELQMDAKIFQKAFQP